MSLINIREEDQKAGTNIEPCDVSSSFKRLVISCDVHQTCTIL